MRQAPASVFNRTQIFHSVQCVSVMAVCTLTLHQQVQTQHSQNREEVKRVRGVHGQRLESLFKGPTCLSTCCRNVCISLNVLELNGTYIVVKKNKKNPNNASVQK